MVGYIDAFAQRVHEYDKNNIVLMKAQTVIYTIAQPSSVCLESSGFRGTVSGERKDW